jgi:hypothetical protein
MSGREVGLKRRGGRWSRTMAFKEKAGLLMSKTVTELPPPLP